MSAAKEERSVEICWEEEVQESRVQTTAKERPSAMAMPTLAPKPRGGRRRQQPRSPEEAWRPCGPRATVIRRPAAAADELVGTDEAVGGSGWRGLWKGRTGSGKEGRGSRAKQSVAGPHWQLGLGQG
jgi:hypothetical protein